MLKVRTVLTAASLLVLCTACDPGSIPNRNVQDVRFEVRDLTDTNRQVVVDNRNNVRVGTEFKIRIYRAGQRPPIRETIEHAYVAGMMEGTIALDLSELCDPSAAPFEAGQPAAEEGAPTEAAVAPPAVPACSDLRVHATLLQTYWLADE